MVALRHAPELADELSALARTLEAIRFGPGLSELAADRDRLVTSIRTYLIPRSRNPDLPMSVVFAGPTGSGKSTLVNSLSGRDLSPAGYLRPTTSHPLALASPGHAADYDEVGEVVCEVVSGEAPVLDAMTLIDTPDIDSTERRHRVIAESLIDNADVVVFVVSALRYADAVPWQVLRRAESRGAHVLAVLNRVGSATSGAVVDFRSRLADAGLDDDLVIIPEHHLSPDAQRIPNLAVRSLKRSLAGIATERAERARAIFHRVCRATLAQTLELVREIDRVTRDESQRTQELALKVVDRLAGLDLTPASSGLVAPLPVEPSAREQRRWLRANRMGEEVTSAVQKRVCERLDALIRSDLESFVWAQGAPQSAGSALDELAAHAVRSWVGYVRRVAAETEAVGGLAETVLLIAALSDGEAPPPEAEAVFGDAAPAVLERVRRELTGRLEVVYGQAATDIIDFAGRDLACPDEIHAVIGAVSVTLAPSDA